MQVGGGPSKQGLPSTSMLTVLLSVVPITCHLAIFPKIVSTVSQRRYLWLSIRTWVRTSRQGPAGEQSLVQATVMLFSKEGRRLERGRPHSSSVFSFSFARSALV